MNMKINVAPNGNAEDRRIQSYNPYYSNIIAVGYWVQHSTPLLLRAASFDSLLSLPSCTCAAKSINHADTVAFMGYCQKEYAQYCHIHMHVLFLIYLGKTWGWNFWNALQHLWLCSQEK